MLINEIFIGMSGEVGVFPQGSIAYFIRTQGCNLKCSYCDTIKAQSTYTGTAMSPRLIANWIEPYSNVVLTGGEPLKQNDSELMELTYLLLQKNCLIQVETNGSVIPFLPIPHIMDYKLPSSYMENEMIDIKHFSNKNVYFIKFVIKNDIDVITTFHILGEILDITDLKELPYIAISIENKHWYEYIRNQFLNNFDDYIPDYLYDFKWFILSNVVFNIQLHKQLDIP